MLQAFGVHFLKEVTRQQLVRAINNHLPQNAERKALLTAPKTSLLKPLAQGLLAKKIIQINSGADVCDLTRDEKISCSGHREIPPESLNSTSYSQHWVCGTKTTLGFCSGILRFHAGKTCFHWWKLKISYTFLR